ncbi:MAG: sigma-E processing peptidase SpoIIGA [Clostridia bacterium]|nr:sigma-E processing peptidase SpoIIGA [Clostridia bacterium]
MYIEVFIADNFIMDLLILRLAAAFVSIKVKRSRLALFALIGTAAALLGAYFPAVFASPASKLLQGALLSFALPPRGVRARLIAVIAVLLSAAAVGGAALITVYLFGGFHGGVPLLAALVGAAAAAALPRSVRRILARRVPENLTAEVIAELPQGKTLEFAALVDTGNRLIEPVSALPVIVISAKKYAALSKTATLPVPIHTAGGAGLIYALKPRAVRVNGAPVEALIAFSSAATALVPACLAFSRRSSGGSSEISKRSYDDAETYKVIDREAV